MASSSFKMLAGYFMAPKESSQGFSAGSLLIVYGSRQT
jgi:hypothetical protein